MTKVDELRATLRRLPEIYGSGDFEGYIEHYAPDLTSCFEGVVSNYDEACSFIRSMFAGGGRTLEFQTGDRADDSVRRRDRRQRNAGHRRRKREGQVDHRVDDTAAGEFVAYQPPVHSWI